jgi:hypothetical protein
MTRTTKALFIILAAIYGGGGIRDSWTRIGVSDKPGHRHRRR